MSQHIYVAIDDTDNATSRGTGHMARTLAAALADAGLGRIDSITRHQHLIDSRIDYTSHNSSACIGFFLDGDIEEVKELSRAFVWEQAAEGSDAGLCILPSIAVSEAVKDHGRKSKEIVLAKEDAVGLAAKEGIFLIELSGLGIGVIGALAAVGLRAAGDDGRYLWLRGMRDLEPGVYELRDVINRTDIEILMTADGVSPVPDELIEIDDWVRPVLLNGKATLLIEEDEDERKVRWRNAGKSVVKRH